MREPPSIGAPGDVDRLIHEPARFAIMAHLSTTESADPTTLLAHTGLTWGNLSSHVTRLEDAGYLSVEKGYRGRRPTTVLRLTPEGRGALLAYRERMMSTLSALGP